MLGRILGAVIGNRIDRRDGSGGIKGAVTGALIAGGLRRMGPLGMVLGAAYMGKKALDGRRVRRRGY